MKPREHQEGHPSHSSPHSPLEATAVGDADEDDGEGRDAAVGLEAEAEVAAPPLSSLATLGTNF